MHSSPSSHGPQSPISSSTVQEPPQPRPRAHSLAFSNPTTAQRNVQARAFVSNTKPNYQGCIAVTQALLVLYPDSTYAIPLSYNGEVSQDRRRLKSDGRESVKSICVSKLKRRAIVVCISSASLLYNELLSTALESK